MLFRSEFRKLSADAKADELFALLCFDVVPVTNRLVETVDTLVRFIKNTKKLSNLIG